MKKLLVSLVLFIAIASVNEAFAQLTEGNDDNGKPGVKSAPKKVVEKIDKNTTVLIFKGTEYRVLDGIWYAKINNKLTLRKAPVGAKINVLPKNGEFLTLTGKEYYKCKGVFYEKLKKGGYIVANP